VAGKGLSFESFKVRCCEPHGLGFKLAVTGHKIGAEIGESRAAAAGTAGNSFDGPAI
jgi:hypothetical protein